MYEGYGGKGDCGVMWRRRENASPKWQLGHTIRSDSEGVGISSPMLVVALHLLGDPRSRLERRKRRRRDFVDLRRFLRYEQLRNQIQAHTTVIAERCVSNSKKKTRTAEHIVNDIS